MSNLQPGQMLGSYQIIQPLGQGGMATVYKAYHAAMDRYVALKVLSHQFSQSAEFLGRFRHEARLLAKLEHAHILPVHDFGESEGIPYLVMRFLDAGTLKDRLAAGPLDFSEIDRIFTQLAEALAYAHEMGVIHRDIKPSNAMLDRHGSIFLTDFGIAKLIEGSPQFTMTGAITGTPAYMSPEQAQGEKIDQRSDIYSLGIVLYEMVTGKVPFEAETPLAIIIKQIQEPLPPISSIKPDIHPTLEAVLLKALTKNPADRFASVDDFLAAWKRAIAAAEQAQPSTPAPSPVYAQPPTPVLEPEPSPPKPEPEPVSSPPPAMPSEAVSLPPLPPADRSTSSTRLPAPVKKGRFPCLWVGGVVTIVGIVAIFCLFAIILRRTDRSTPTPENIIAAAPQPADEWQSWTGANQVLSIAFRQDQILTAGPGGASVWDSSGNLVDRYTTEKGLPSSSITLVYVDETDDSLWFGTYDGLAHLEGNNWTIYTEDHGLDSSYISAITQIEDRLWVGTSYSGDQGSGLQIFENGIWKSVTGFPSLEEHIAQQQSGTLSYNINQILADDNNRIWVATSYGLGMFDGRTWNVIDTVQGLPRVYIQCMLLDEDDQLWVTTEDALYRLTENSFQKVQNLNELDLYEILAMVQDDKGMIWLAAGWGGLGRYDPAINEWKFFSSREGDFPVTEIFSAASDGKRLFFGSITEGLIVYENETFTTWKILNSPHLANFGRILSTPDGQLWFLGEYDEDWDIYDPVQKTWSPRPETDLCCPIPLAWDQAGNLWNGGYTGLWLFSDGKYTQLTSYQGLPSDEVNAIAFTPDGTAWVGTFEGLVTVRDMKVENIYTTASAGLPGNNITVLHVASDGILWVGSQKGVSLYKSSGQWEHYSLETFSDQLEWVTDITETSDGNLWIATHGAGLFRYTVDAGFQQYLPRNEQMNLPSEYINALTAAPDGSLWMGFYYEGAGLWKDNLLTTYTREDGLVDWNVNDIHVDSSGQVWFATSGGVSRKP